MTLSICVLLLAGQPPPLPRPAEYERVMTRHTRLRYRGDLDEIKRRGVLRVLTRNNSSSYFISKGRELGFQYEMARALADELRVRLAMVVPSSRAGLIPALLKGEGDVIAAGMSATPARAKLVTFTGPLFEGQRVLVTHRDIIKPLLSVQDLAAFTVHVVKRSTTYRQAVDLGRQLGAPLRIEGVPPQVEMEEMIRRVRSGRYEATIVDRNVLDLEQASGSDVVVRLEIGRPLPKVWAVRPSSVQLAEAASAFIDGARARGFTRVLLSKYFRPGARGARWS